METQHETKIHCLGRRGAYSHQVAETLAENWPLDCPPTQGIKPEITFHGSAYAALCALETDRCPSSMAVVPIENSTAGLVADTVQFWKELLLEPARDLARTFNVIHEVRMPIRHCLAARGPGDWKFQVLSHQQGLDQCRAYLRSKGLTSAPRLSTADAAKEVADSLPGTAAALCSRFAAELYGLEILEENVQDDDANETRFHILCRLGEANGVRASRTSILFEVPNKPFSLAPALLMIGAHGVNMSCLHSVNLGPGRYAHYVEMDVGASTSAGKRAIDCLQSIEGINLIMLGSYPQAPAPKGGAA
jgi:prephenate dehydratase